MINLVIPPPTTKSTVLYLLDPNQEMVTSMFRFWNAENVALQSVISRGVLKRCTIIFELKDDNKLSLHRESVDS